MALSFACFEVKFYIEEEKRKRKLLVLLVLKLAEYADRFEISIALSFACFEVTNFGIFNTDLLLVLLVLKGSWRLGRVLQTLSFACFEDF